MAAGSTLRVIDAAANRVREGLRVAEDWARFVLGDAGNSASLRDVRHGMVAAVGRIASVEELLAARDTPGDPGATPDAFPPAARTSEREVVVSAFKRAEEGLRTLAEFAKPLAPEASGHFERLRYRLYEVEKRVLLQGADRALIAGARLMAIVMDEESARRALALKAGVLELAFDGGDRAACALVRRVVALARDAGAVVLVRSRADIARAAGAQGVVLGPADMDVECARAVLGQSSAIGVHCQTLEDAVLVAEEGATFAILPVGMALVPDASPTLPLAIDAQPDGEPPAPPFIARIDARSRVR